MTARLRAVPTGPHRTLLLEAGPDWMTDPARGCYEGNVDDIDIFFEDIHRAKKICHRCPFEQECDDWATEQRIPFGVWGGRNRDSIRPGRQQQVAA